MACASALTFLTHGGNNSIVILSSCVESSMQLDERVSVQKITVPHSLSDFQASRLLKTQLLEFSCFEQTLYVDSDILSFHSIEKLWDERSISMGFAYAPTIGECAHVGSIEKQYTLDFIGDCNFPQYNSGVILFDRSKLCVDFFDRWHGEWLKYKKHDQLALARSISQYSSMINDLPQKYNCPSSIQTEDSILIHFSGLSQKYNFWQHVHPDVISTIDKIF